LVDVLEEHVEVLRKVMALAASHEELNLRLYVGGSHRLLLQADVELVVVPLACVVLAVTVVLGEQRQQRAIEFFLVVFLMSLAVAGSFYLLRWAPVWNTIFSDGLGR
jgi:hypothetical protein